MKIKPKDDMLIITTEAYQARNGGIYINWGHTIVAIPEYQANMIADNIPNIDRDLYNNFYVNSSVPHKATTY